MKICDIVRQHIFNEMMEPGDRGTCPVCKGGSSKEKSLSVWETDEGHKMATCHRAQCAVGTVRSTLSVRPDTKSTDDCRAARNTFERLRAGVGAVIGEGVTYSGEVADALRPYIPDNWPILKDRSLLADMIYRGSVLVPHTIYNEEAYESAGCPINLPVTWWSGQLEAIVVRRLRPLAGQPKALTYQNPERDATLPLMALQADSRSLTHQGIMTAPPTFVLVEDIPSAMALRAVRGTHVWPVALLGTRITLQHLEALTDLGKSSGYRRSEHEIVIALDADATHVAIEALQKWGTLFNLRVMRLEKDFKNMTREEIETYRFV